MTGKKDAHGTRLPVTQYRKQIGKQDAKKSKGELKEIKKQAQAKKTISSTYKDISLMVGTLGIVVFSIYAAFYYFLQSKSA